MLSSEFVLIYDPDSVNTALLKFALEEKNIRTLVVQHWSSLLDSLTDKDLRVLIFHSDEALPKALEQLREIYEYCFPLLPIILTTHDCSPERTQGLQEKAGVSVICKPYHLQFLIKKVQEKFIQEQEDYFFYRELEFKEALLRQNQMLQQQAILLTAVNNELLKKPDNTERSTKEIILFAVDLELRYLYFTPDHAIGMQRIFAANIQIGTKVTDFPWPKSFESIVQILAESFHGKEVFKDFYLNFDSIHLFIKAKATPLRLPNQAIFGALVRLDQYFADQVQDEVPQVTMNSYFQEEFVSLALRHLERIYLVCDEDFHVLYCIQNQANLPPPSFFTNKQISDLLASPLDLNRLKKLKENQALWLHWIVPGLTNQLRRTALHKIDASLHPSARYMVIIHIENLLKHEPTDSMLSLWNQSKLPLEVYDQDGCLLAANQAWRLLISKKIPAKTSLPSQPSKAQQSFQFSDKWWRVFFFSDKIQQVTVALYIPIKTTQKTRWLDGPEVVSLIAHQWRQPLAQLGSLINLLTLRTSIRPEAHHNIGEKLERAQTLVQHLSATIDDFRKYMTPNKVKTQVDLVELSQNVALLFKEKIIDLDVDWCWEIESQPIPVTIYPGLLSQALIEAIHNCFVALEKVDHRRNLTFKLRQTDGQTELELQHNGKRFPADIISAFQRHQKLKSTGMGLKFIRRVICKVHKGRYKIVQDENGVTQKFQLPGDKHE